MNSKFRLVQEIIRRSVAGTWEVAKREWDLEEVYRQEDPGTCLCGKYPIKEICVLRNRRNDATAEVGNVCVKKFLGLPSGRIFDGLRRIANDVSKALNADLIQHAYDRRWITKWEMVFSLDTMLKRNLTERQLDIREQINEKVLSRTRRIGAS